MSRPIWPTAGDSAANGKPWDQVVINGWNQISDTADAALAAAQSASAGGLPGVVALDSFAGATDDDKLTAALAYASSAARARRPGILMPGRDLTFNVKARTPYSGMALLFPRSFGWQNPEIANSNGAFTNHRVTIGSNIGTGVNSWFVGTSTTYDVIISGGTFVGHAGAQWYHHPFSAGSCYAGHFDNLTFMNFKHVLGMPNDAWSNTLCTLAGTWGHYGVAGTQFSTRGSDSFFVPLGMNYGWAGQNAGQYLWRFENQSKTMVRNLYLTARGGSRAILVDGPASQQGGLFISDCIIEGQNYTDPAFGALIRHRGGGAMYHNISFNFGMSSPSTFTDITDTDETLDSTDSADATNATNATNTIDAATSDDFSFSSCEVHGMERIDTCFQSHATQQIGSDDSATRLCFACTLCCGI